MNHRTSHNGRTALLELAKQSIVRGREALLPAVVTLTPGVDPIRRRRLWDTVCEQVEILADIDNGWWMQAVHTYLGIEDASSRDAERLAGEATEDRDDAIDQLLRPALPDPHTAGTCTYSRCFMCRLATKMARASA